MDNRGTPAPSNSQIRQNRDALFPNRRVTQNVEDHEPSSRRINTEAENVADENNRGTLSAIPIVISSGSEDGSDDDAAFEEAERRRKGKAVVSASNPEPKRKGKPAARAIPAGIVIKEQDNGKSVEKESESETDSEDDAELQIGLKVAMLESLNTQHVEARESSEAEPRKKRKAAEHDIPLGAEYERQLEFTIQESLKSCYNNLAGRSLDAHALRTETGLARGNESPKGKRKIKAKKQKIVEPDVARGKFINSSSDIEPTGSMPHQGVSSRGRLLKPTSKLLQLDAPLPLNRGPRRSYRRHGSQQNRLQLGVAGVSEGSGSVVSKASQANGVARLADVVNPDGSGVGGEVGGSEPDEDYWIPDLIVVPFYEPTSVAGQAREANAVGRQTDMVVPLLEPMVCATNQNPMDFTIEEAKKYMRTE